MVVGGRKILEFRTKSIGAFIHFDLIIVDGGTFEKNYSLGELIERRNMISDSSYKYLCWAQEVVLLMPSTSLLESSSQSRLESQQHMVTAKTD